jgi:hypothetical protein
MAAYFFNADSVQMKIKIFFLPAVLLAGSIELLPGTSCRFAPGKPYAISYGRRTGNAIYPQTIVLNPESYKHYIDSFNVNDQERYPQYIPNNKSWKFFRQKAAYPSPQKVELDLGNDSVQHPHHSN